MHVRLEKGGLRFSGVCSSCWKSCRATCCRTMAIPLTEEEIARQNPEFRIRYPGEIPGSRIPDSGL